MDLEAAMCNAEKIDWAECPLVEIKPEVQKRLCCAARGCQ